MCAPSNSSSILGYVIFLTTVVFNRFQLILSKVAQHSAHTFLPPFAASVSEVAIRLLDHDTPVQTHQQTKTPRHTKREKISYAFWHSLQNVKCSMILDKTRGKQTIL